MATSKKRNRQVLRLESRRLENGVPIPVICIILYLRQLSTSKSATIRIPVRGNQLTTTPSIISPLAAPSAHPRRRIRSPLVPPAPRARPVYQTDSATIAKDPIGLDSRLPYFPRCVHELVHLPGLLIRQLRDATGTA
jgi:hypothetical protein